MYCGCLQIFYFIAMHIIYCTYLYFQESHAYVLSKNLSRELCFLYADGQNVLYCVVSIVSNTRCTFATSTVLVCLLLLSSLQTSPNFDDNDPLAPPGAEAYLSKTKKDCSLCLRSSESGALRL